MPRIITALEEIAPAYRALFVDLWGCLHDGYHPFPAAVAALRRYRDRAPAGAGHVILVTNSPRSRGGVIRQLDRIGVPREIYDDVASSGDAAQAAMLAGLVGAKVHHVGPARDISFFEDVAEDIRADLPPEAPSIVRVPLEEAEGIVLTGLEDDEHETPEDYRARLLAARARELPLLCANPDLMVDRGDKRVWCAGAIARLYEEMGGRVFYFGKPNAPIYALARRRLARAAGEPVPDDAILAIGDGIATDIAGAIGEGLDTLFVTGGLAAEATGTGPPPAGQPDPARLEAFLAEAKLAPTCAIGHLR